MAGSTVNFSYDQGCCRGKTGQVHQNRHGLPLMRCDTNLPEDISNLVFEGEMIVELERDINDLLHFVGGQIFYLMYLLLGKWMGEVQDNHCFLQISLRTEIWGKASPAGVVWGRPL